MPQIELSRLSHLARDQEEGPLEIHKIHVYNWIVKRAGVCLFQSFHNLRDGEPLDIDAVYAALEVDKPIGLDHDGRFVELRREGERDRQRVRCSDSVPAVSLLEVRLI